MKTRSLLLIALFAALTTLGAFIRIPTPLSSFTLQVLFTCMAGVLLGAKCGAASQLIYVLLGLIGMPIFTAGGGFNYIFNPTFGFLLGLIPMAAIVGLLSKKLNYSFWGICVACLAGLTALYAIGLPYMHLIITLYLNKPYALMDTIYSGMLIFLPWDFLKIALTAILCRHLLPRIKQYLILK